MSARCCEPQPKGQGWKWSTCGERLLMWNGSSFLFFPSLHHIHSFHSKPWPRFALPPAHSLPAPLTHLMLLYFYQTQLSHLTSPHPSICPSSFPCIFSHCPRYLHLYPYNSHSSSIFHFLFLTWSFHLSLIPLHPISLSNPYSCNFYMAAWGCC